MLEWSGMAIVVDKTVVIVLLLAPNIHITQQMHQPYVRVGAVFFIHMRNLCEINTSE